MGAGVRSQRVLEPERERDSSSSGYGRDLLGNPSAGKQAPRKKGGAASRGGLAAPDVWQRLVPDKSSRGFVGC